MNQETDYLTWRATVLIVDDTPANLGVIVDALGERGFLVLIAQDGTVITSSPGPVTGWSAFIYAGSPGWHGAGDYTACAKNNGTQTVFLNYLTVNGN